MVINIAKFITVVAVGFAIVMTAIILTGCAHPCSSYKYPEVQAMCYEQAINRDDGVRYPTQAY